MPDLQFFVDADVISADGGSDAAYDLLGTHTADSLCELLRRVLTQTVKSMLFNGSEDSGYVLRIVIRDSGTGPSDPIARLAENDRLTS